MSNPLQKKVESIPVSYYPNGLMKYHPDYHPNFRKRFTRSDYEYLCKYYEIDGIELMSLALGRPPKSIVSIIYHLRKKGMYEYYKNLNEHWL